MENSVILKLSDYEKLKQQADEAALIRSLVIKNTYFSWSSPIKTEYLHKEDAISDIEKMYEIAIAETVSDFKRKLKKEIDSLEKMSLICFLRKKFFTKSK